MTEISTFLEAHRVDLAALPVDAVVGIGDALGELGSIAARIIDPALCAAGGAGRPSSVLLVGRPGSGKTTTARWFARRLGPDVPFYRVSANALDAQTVTDTFAALGDATAVVLVEEIDLIAPRRDGPYAGGLATLGALLEVTDGLAGRTGPVLVATTSRPVATLDASLVRPGRLGTHILLGIPDDRERRELLGALALGRALAPDVDLDALVPLTPSATPGLLRAIFDDAFGMAVAAGRTVVGQGDLVAVAERRGRVPAREPEVPAERMERYAWHEGSHAVCAAALRGPAWVHSARIGSDGGTTSLGGEDLQLDDRTEDEVDDMVTVAYAGLHGERLRFGSATLASEGDCSHAARLLEMKANAGLLRNIPPLPDVSPVGWTSDRRISGGARSVMVREAEAAFDRANVLVSANRAAIGVVAEALLRERHLSGPALHDLLEGAGIVDGLGHAIDADR